jgi:hypothetical protein
MFTDEYAAGFFDGEGTVYAATRNKSYKNPTIIVSISNTVREPLDAALKKWGGSISSNQPPGNRRRQYQWVLSSRQAEPFLRAIQPHVMIKKGVVDAAIEYCELMKTPIHERMDYSQLRPSKTPGKMTRAGVMRPEFKAKVTAIHDRIKALNVRGAPFNATRRHSTASAPEPNPDC